MPLAFIMSCVAVLLIVTCFATVISRIAAASSLVYGLTLIAAQVEHLATLCGQESLYRLLQRESGMIRTYRDAHCSPRFRDLLLCRNDNVLRSEAELLLQFLERRRGAERLHADALTAPADIPRPAEGGPLFRRDARGY